MRVPITTEGLNDAWFRKQLLRVQRLLHQHPGEQLTIQTAERPVRIDQEIVGTTSTMLLAWWNRVPTDKRQCDELAADILAQVEPDEHGDHGPAGSDLPIEIWI